MATSTQTRTRTTSSASLLDAPTRRRKGFSGRWEAWRQKLSVHRKRGESISEGTETADEGRCTEESQLDDKSSMTSHTGAEDGHGDHGCEPCSDREDEDEQQMESDEGSAEERTAEPEPVYTSEHVEKLRQGKLSSVHRCETCG